jgi:hypothetical protein
MNRKLTKDDIKENSFFSGPKGNFYFIYGYSFSLGIMNFIEINNISKVFNIYNGHTFDAVDINSPIARREFLIQLIPSVFDYTTDEEDNEYYDELINYMLPRIMQSK